MIKIDEYVYQRHIIEPYRHFGTAWNVAMMQRARMSQKSRVLAQSGAESLGRRGGGKGGSGTGGECDGARQKAGQRKKQA